MAKRSDWMPSNRNGQIAMALLWATVFTSEGKDADGKPVKKWVLWGIPQAVLTAFMLALDDARSALETAINTGSRNDVSNHRVETAFKILVEQMRFIKSHYLLMPPLTEDDYRDLGLRPRDPTVTKTGEPTAQMRVKFFYMGQHQIGTILEYVSGDPSDPANKVYHVYYLILEHGEEMPAEPSTKWESFSTKRLRNEMNLAYGDSGKRVVFAVRIENSRKVGPWGPMSTIIIP